VGSIHRATELPPKGIPGARSIKNRDYAGGSAHVVVKESRVEQQIDPPCPRARVPPSNLRRSRSECQGNIAYASQGKCADSNSNSNSQLTCQELYTPKRIQGGTFSRSPEKMYPDIIALYCHSRGLENLKAFGREGVLLA